jgi:hypothetical protein
MPSSITVIGLDELRQRFRAFPEKFRAGVAKALEASLLVLWENVPPYPAPPPDSDYRRTGTLGRTLGAGGAKPDIYAVKQEGGYWVGEFGTNLEYAPYVIGDETQAHQNAHWWTMSVIGEKAEEKILAVFDMLAEKLAAWLDRNENI